MTGLLIYLVGLVFCGLVWGLFGHMIEWREEEVFVAIFVWPITGVIAIAVFCVLVPMAYADKFSHWVRTHRTNKGK